MPCFIARPFGTARFGTDPYVGKSGPGRPYGVHAYGMGHYGVFCFADLSIALLGRSSINPVAGIEVRLNAALGARSSITGDTRLYWTTEVACDETWADAAACPAAWTTEAACDVAWVTQPPPPLVCPHLEPANG